MWDFQTELGRTIREKYEHLYVKVVEVSNVINRRIRQGHNWIIMSPEVMENLFGDQPKEQVNWKEEGF